MWFQSVQDMVYIFFLLTYLQKKEFFLTLHRTALCDVVLHIVRLLMDIFLYITSVTKTIYQQPIYLRSALAATSGVL